MWLVFKFLVIFLIVDAAGQRYSRNRYRGGTVPTASPSPVALLPATFATPVASPTNFSVGITETPEVKAIKNGEVTDAVQESGSQTTFLATTGDENPNITMETNDSSVETFPDFDYDYGEPLPALIVDNFPETITVASSTFMGGETFQGQEESNHTGGQDYNDDIEEKQTPPHPDTAPKTDSSAGKLWTSFRIHFPGNYLFFNQ